MSAEIIGRDARNDEIVTAVSLNVAKIMEATGVSPEVAYTTGVTAATYAIELLLSATDGCSETAPGGFSDEMMIDSVTVIADATVHPDHLAYYQAYEEGAGIG